MAVNLTKQSIDIGLVARDPDAMATFYGEILGFEEQAPMGMPGMRIRPFACGESVIKIVSLKNPPEAASPAGGLAGGTGIRYYTIRVANLAEVIATVEAAQCTVAVPITQAGEGLALAIVEDPDGNWVEFVQRDDV